MTNQAEQMITLEKTRKRALVSKYLMIAALLSTAACEKKAEEKPSTSMQKEAAPVAAPQKEISAKKSHSSPQSHAPANPHGAANPHVAASPQAPAAGSKQLAIIWEVPKKWQEDKKPRMMRAATYHAPGEKGPAEIAVFFFGANQGGDVEANIARWVGQFKDVPADGVKRDTSEANGLKRYTVSISEGSFASGMPGAAAGAKDKWGMEGAIVETPSGRYFFKMTGPAGTVAAQKASFTSLLDSIKTRS